MKAKLFEIRDKGTFIPCIGILMAEPDIEAERYLLRRAGYNITDPPFCILLARIAGTGKAEYDPYSWGDRTFAVAHQFIQKEWFHLESGAVVDVEFILGETKVPKKPERSTV